MSVSLAYEDVWTERPVYEAAEQRYYESLSREVKWILLSGYSRIFIYCLSPHNT